MTHRLRNTLAISVVASMLFAISFAVPAMGGPSLGGVYKVAKKALSTGKHAQRSADGANANANDAYDLAGHADTNATNALAHGQITLVTGSQVFYGSSAVQTAIAFCPTGQRVISGGGVNIADEQLAVSTATAGRSGWGVIGVDLYDNGGEYIQAQALCAPSGQAFAANHTAARVNLTQQARAIARNIKAH
jgi:hypothetical protein